ncbi:MAG TPA: glutathione binding-like protein, partial [Acetobacteraceae bacterium]|nr:glutathione binding-like protein [Acetobacteraceae bacterium]
QAQLAPPAGDRRRGPYYRWLFFGAGPVEAAVTNKALDVAVSDQQRRMVGYGSLDAVLNTLECAVSNGEYLTGETFTAADVYLGAQIAWGMHFGTIEKRPAFERYAARITGRPAALRARELDDALIPK